MRARSGDDEGRSVEVDAAVYDAAAAVARDRGELLEDVVAQLLAEWAAGEWSEPER